jgi:protein-L-isoaspartate O-methyltransferase
MLSFELLAFLQTPRAESVLAELAQSSLQSQHALTILTRLRKHFSPQEASALLETAQLRQKAILKFGKDAQHMFFTADAVEQASDPLIRRYRAQQVHGRVLDVCCSIGSDSMAFAQAHHNVLGLDIDPLRIAIAEHNAQVLGVADRARFRVQDVLSGIPSDYDTLFFDPARRGDDGKRVFHVEQYQPPLSLLKSWRFARVLAKLSPGVDLLELAEYNGVVEFISVKGELKEAVLHQNSGWQGHTATLLNGDTIQHWSKTTPDEAIHIPIASPHGWLFEPDPSILRAGLVRDIAQTHALTFLDETIAYLCGDAHLTSVWLRAWQIVDWMPFNIKKMRAYLRERNVGQITVKKRGSPLTPEELMAQLKLKGENTRTIVLTRWQGEPIMIVCAPQPTV